MTSISSLTNILPILVHYMRVFHLETGVLVKSVGMIYFSRQVIVSASLGVSKHILAQIFFFVLKYNVTICGEN